MAAFRIEVPVIGYLRFDVEAGSVAEAKHKLFRAGAPDEAQGITALDHDPINSEWDGNTNHWLTPGEEG
jgi:hypothetical protein